MQKSNKLKPDSLKLSKNLRKMNIDSSRAYMGIHKDTLVEDTIDCYDIILN